MTRPNLAVPLLPRYLLRSYFPTFSLCLGVFLFVLLMNYFLRLFNVAVMKGISLGWIFFCFSRLLPHFLSLALPMAFLVALLLTLGQLSESGEVLAMRSSGFSFKEILAPFLALSLLLSLLLFHVNHNLSPDSFHSFKTAYSQAVSRVARVELEPRTFLPLGEWRFYAEKASSGGALEGVRMVKQKGAYRRLRIAAPEGWARVEAGRGVALELSGGTLQWPNEDPASHTRASFRRYRLFVPFVDPRWAEREWGIQEMSTARLRERLLGGLEVEKRKEYRTEAAVRTVSALAPFVVFWVACPLGLRLERRSRAIGFALSLVLMFAYYGLLAVGIGLGRRAEALSDWAPWLPDVACLAAGLFLWRSRLRR